MKKKLKKKIPSETLYVKKIENFPENYILGMDLSSLIAEENSGVKYYNFENQEKDIFKTWSYVGINYIRIRIWNDRFKNEGVDVGMVALGNEINDHFCGETLWPRIVKIMNATSKATREVLPECLISVHFTNPEREGSMMYFARNLDENNLDYDVFSVSYYNVWAGEISHLNQLNDVANTYNKKIFIAETQYPYSRDNFDEYPNKTPGYDDYLFYPITVQGQANHIRDLFDYVINIKNSIGVFYWEAAWIAVGKNWAENYQKWETYGSGWASSYSYSYDPERYAGMTYGGGAATENQALFDSDGKPLESLKVFNLMKYGNEINIIEDGVEDISINPIDFTQSFLLPDKINVIYTNNHTLSRNAIWNDDIDINKAKNEIKYEMSGTADNIDIKCVFENNTTGGRRFICSYYIEEKFLSPLKYQYMLKIREK